MFEKGQEAGSPCVLVIKDNHEDVLGAYLSEPPLYRKGYYGNGTT